MKFNINKGYKASLPVEKIIKHNAIKALLPNNGSSSPLPLFVYKWKGHNDAV